MTDHKPLTKGLCNNLSRNGWNFAFTDDVRSAVEGLRKEFQDDCLIENCVLCLDDDERIKKWFPAFYNEEEVGR